MHYTSGMLSGLVKCGGCLEQRFACYEQTTIWLLILSQTLAEEKFMLILVYVYLLLGKQGGGTHRCEC